MPDKDRKTVKSNPKKEKKISVEVLEHAFIKSVRNVLTCRGTYNQPDLYHYCYHPSQPNQSKYVQI